MGSHGSMRSKGNCRIYLAKLFICNWAPKTWSSRANEEVAKEELISEAGFSQIQIPALCPSGCVTWDKLLRLSVLLISCL